MLNVVDRRTATAGPALRLTPPDLDPPHARGPLRAGSRRAFVAFAALYVVVAVVGFAPSFARARAGAQQIHWFAHVHGSLMSAWLLLYAAQARLAAAGALGRHRALGRRGVWLAAVIWCSMLPASVRVRVALDPPVDGFLWDVWLIELMMTVLVPTFVIAGWRAPRRTGAHERWMTFAVAVPLQSALDRTRWLPDLGLPRHWGNDVWVYVILLPLVVYDVVTTGRVHRATLAGLALLGAGHFVVNALWGSPAWHATAYALFHSFH